MKNQEVTFLSPSLSIGDSINLISKNAKKTKCPGIAVIIKNNKLLGIITDGDIRRAYASKIDFKLPIKKIMNNDPIVLPEETPIQNIVTLTRNAVAQSNRLSSDHVKYVILIDKKRNFKKIYDYLKLLNQDLSSKRTVAILGMGYVGLTLAVSLANKGHIVSGIDINKDIIKNLNLGKTNIYEPGLNSILKSNIKSKKISFLNSLKNNTYDIYIIGVGTPIKNKKPNLKFLKNSVLAISKKIKRGDHVMLRSTVPVGTTREFVIKILEKNSNLLAGRDFYISFTPERTIEGNALYELRNLPQIIGGFTPGCSKASADFWSTITSKIIKVESLEAAELVKLANNTFRDLSFAYSNELALKCSKYNLNAFSLISAANDGYPRNQIPLPSPGVGGTCLTKDPILYSSNLNGIVNRTLGTYGRNVNNKAGAYVLKILSRYSRKNKILISKMKILIVGIAFKGEPANYDIRNSVPLEVTAKIRDKCKKLYLWDATIKAKHGLIKNLIADKDLKKIANSSDAILILNNNRENIRITELISGNKKQLIFDGWNLFDQSEIEKNQNLSYSTMGYLGD